MPTVLSTPTKPKTRKNADLRALYRNSRLPIVAKWSLAIGVLITTVMGLLSWVLITQQTHSFMQQTEAFGRILVEQLAHSASEPVMAEDHFTLTGLVNRQIGSAQVISALIRQGNNTLAKAGVIPPLEKQNQIIQNKAKQVVWSWHDNTGTERKAITFATPIQFMDVTPGYALITLDRDQLDREQHEAMFVLAYTTLGLILLGVVMAYILSRHLSRPIQELAEVGETISRGESITSLDHLRRDEIGRIINSFNLMVDGIREKGRVERALSSYVSPHAAPRVLANLEQPANASEQLFGSVLFCDIVGYTKLTEGMPPKVVADMLNEYLGYIALAGHSCHGMVDKFIGDSVMIVFGAPESDKQHALHAIACGVMIQEIVQHINQQRQRKTLQPLHFRIGINSGDMMAGNIGIPVRMQYTVVGDTVNLGARLCSIAPPNGILIGSNTAEQNDIKQKVILRQQSPVQVKGRNQPVTSYLVDSMNPKHQQQVQQAIEQLLPTKCA
ncbi:adenylate/guanylate cyclase domain-containing protein [Pseudomonadota bacterium]